MKVKDVLIVTTASTDSNWANQYEINGVYSAGADLRLAMNALNIAEQNNIPVHYGNILAADVFYDHNPDQWKKWKALGVLGVEMESYSLYCNAAKLNKKALCLLTVTDSFVKPERLSSEERAFGLGRMIELAILVAEKDVE